MSMGTQPWTGEQSHRALLSDLWSGGSRGKKLHPWHQERNHLETAVSKMPQGQESAHDLPVDCTGPLLGTLGSCTWVLTRIDTYFTLRFTYPVTIATLKNTVRSQYSNSLLFSWCRHNVTISGQAGPFTTPDMQNGQNTGWSRLIP